MSIWEYNDRVAEEDLIAQSIKLKACLFCQTTLKTLINEKHESRRRSSEYRSETLEVKFCPICGWWSACESVNLRWPRKKRTERRCSHRPVVGHRLYGTVAILRNLTLSDISIPVQEVRDYLVAQYEHRHRVHPKLFEDTVASVFRDLGYRVEVTAYTGDDGIDVVLSGIGNEEVGVQVKRYKDSIKVEQIRSFTGALLIGGYTRGIFVTTSRFQSGADRTARLASLRGIRIDLLDAERFYDALRIAQREVYRNTQDLREQLKKQPPTLLELERGGKW